MLPPAVAPPQLPSPKPAPEEEEYVPTAEDLEDDEQSEEEAPYAPGDDRDAIRDAQELIKQTGDDQEEDDEELSEEPVSVRKGKKQKKMKAGTSCCITISVADIQAAADAAIKKHAKGR
jgi:hypothetical protein